MATLPDAWHYHYGVSGRAGWPGVSIQCVDEIVRLISSFCLSLTACQLLEHVGPYSLPFAGMGSNQGKEYNIDAESNHTVCLCVCVCLSNRTRQSSLDMHCLVSVKTRFLNLKTTQSL